MDAAFEGRPAVFPPITAHPDDRQIAEIFRHIGGTDSEPVNPSMLWDQAAPPPRGMRGDVEGVRYLAEFHAPVLVARAQDDPAAGTRMLRDYIALNAANAYRVYRNGSLWDTLRAVAQHRESSCVKEIAPVIVAAALAGAGRDFAGATPLTLLTLRAATDAARRPALDDGAQRLAQKASSLSAVRGRGDSWGDYRRSLGALAEARALVLKQDPLPLLHDALKIAPGYAGVQAPACLALAESLAVCRAPADLARQALAKAKVAAHNVQDLVFCARTVSRLTALTENWWDRPGPGPVGIAALVSRFAANPRAPEFAARYAVGETYDTRRTVNPTRRVPSWLRDATTLEQLARAFQWPLADFVAMNPEVPGPDAPIARGVRVRVPDARWSPMLAAYLAALILQANTFKPLERARLILKLVPGAASDLTALDTVLARLLLALCPTGAEVLAEIETALAAYPLAMS